MKFDPLWQQKTAFPSRNQAYKWLRQFSSTKDKKRGAHIGMFDATQCKRLLAAIAELHAEHEQKNISKKCRINY